VPPPALPPAAWTRRGYPSTARATVAPCVVLPHPRLLPRRWPHRGSYKTSYAAGAVVAFLDGLVLTPAVRTGARTSLRMLGQRPPIGAEVVTFAGGTDVVAAAGEAAHCRGGCLCWRDRQCHLPPDLRLFSFNSLVVAPRRKMGARTFPQRRTC
jgi:hypothetical protein